MYRIIRAALVATSFAFGLLLSCVALGNSPVQAVAQPGADGHFAAVEHRYVVFVLGHFPVVGTFLGGAAFDPQLADIDGKLRDYSPDALNAEQIELSKFRTEFTALDPERLSARRRIDRSVALAQIEFMLHEQQVRRYQQRSLDSYLDEPADGVDWQIQGMTQTGPKIYGTRAEWQAVLKRVSAVPAYLDTAEKQLTAGVAAGNTPDWRMLLEGLKTAQTDAEYFSKTLPQQAAVNAGPSEQMFLFKLQTAGADAAASYKHLREYLIGTFFDDPTATGVTALKAVYRSDRFAMGESEYDWALHNNLQLNTTAADLYTGSWPVVEGTRNSMIALAREIAASHGWPAPAEGPEVVRRVFEKLTHDAPADDDQMVEGYRKMGQRLVQYARDTKLFDIPPDYSLEVTVTPEPLRASVDGAAYYTAPPFKQSGVGRFYVTPTGNDAAELRQQHNYAAMAVLAAHEGFPGHDLHYKVMTHWRDQISPIRWLTPGAVEDSSSMWEDSMAIEGWGLYSEALLAEPANGHPHGFYSPEEHLYQLRGKLLRDLRVRIDTGIHTGHLKFDDAVDLFSETVDFLPGSCRDNAALKDELKQASCNGARRAIARYARWPTQAITYRVGKEQIFALRERAQRELGGAFSLRVFHLELMTQGSIPVTDFGDELIRSMKYEQ